jgi:hypothetical protein
MLTKASHCEVGSLIYKPCDWSKGFFIERLDTKSYDDIMATKRRRKQTDEIQTAIDYGIDITMLIDNINRAPSERIRRHQIALNTAEKLRKAKNK